MSLRIRKKSEKNIIQEELLEFAQLALDVFKDKKHVVGDNQGQKHASRTKKHSEKARESSND